MKRYLALLTIIVLLGGCSKETAPKEETISTDTAAQVDIEVTLSVEEQQEALKQYYNLLKINGNDEGIKSFLDKNLSKLDSENVDAIIISLEDYLLASDHSVDEIGAMLMKYYDNASSEVQYYLDIINREAQMPFTDGERINVELDELLDRMVQAEEYLRNFPEGSRKNKIYDYYKAYIIGSIAGAGNQYIYAEDGSSNIRPEVLNSYNKIIEAYKDFSSSKILTQYIKTLAMDNNDLNGDNTLDFYEDIEGIIKENSDF